MNNHCLISILLFVAFIRVHAQNSLPNYIDKDFRSIEVKVGKNGLLQVPITPNASVLYQKNIGKHLATVFYSEVSLSVFNTNPEKQYLTTNFFSWKESIGIGGTFGKKRFNNSLLLMGGASFYRSHSYVKEELMPEMITKNLSPELGLLYTLKWGKKRVYFSLQHYIPFTPLKMFKVNEVAKTTSLGVGFRW